jgi:hypothetical protein
VLQVEVLILELLAVDGLTTGALLSISFCTAVLVVALTYVATGEVTTLEHELGDDAVEGRALVVEGLARAAGALLTSAESAEVLGSLYHIDQPCVRWRFGKNFDGGVAEVSTLGTWSANSSMTTRPAGAPPMEMSKKTWGLVILIELVMLECWLKRVLLVAGRDGGVAALWSAGEGQQQSSTSSQ